MTPSFLLVSKSEFNNIRGSLAEQFLQLNSSEGGLRMKITEIITPEVFFCYDDENIDDVAHYMQQKEVRRMLILSRQKQLVGVVSLGDIAKSLGEKLAGETLGQIAEAA